MTVVVTFMRPVVFLPLPKIALQLILPFRHELPSFCDHVPYTGGVGDFFYSLLHARQESAHSKAQYCKDDDPD